MARVLRKIPGVQSASASRSPDLAVVVRESGKASNETLCKAVSREGYAARVLKVVRK